MKKKFELKKHLTVTNGFILVIILVYLLDRFLPFPPDYTGYNAWLDESSAVFNYIFGSCGGLVTNYFGFGPVLENGTAIYRRFTLMFLHLHILHLIANCIGMYFIGNYAEKRFGWWLTCIIFVLVAFLESFITDPLFAAIAPEAAEETAMQVGAGASGGIFGLIGALVAAIFFDIKSFKSIDRTTVIVSAIYGFLTTYVASFGWTTVCHNVAMALGLAIGTAIVLPFYLLKKGKFAPKPEKSAETDDFAEHAPQETDKKDENEINSNL